MLKDDAFGADVYLVVLAEELSPLVWMLQAVLLGGLGFGFEFLFLELGGHMLLTVQVVQNREVFD